MAAVLDDDCFNGLSESDFANPPESEEDERAKLASNDSSSLSLSSDSQANEAFGPDESRSASMRLPEMTSSMNGHMQRLPTRVGPRCKLIHEGDIQVCRLNHTRTIISKIMNSKYLRRWEAHRIILGASEIISTTPYGFMEAPILYSNIEDVNNISRWDAGQKFCIRVTVSDGSLLLQAKNSYLRDQWLHSIQWKRYSLKYEKLLKNASRVDVLIKEIKNMVDMSLTTPIQDVSVHQFPLDLVSHLLQENVDSISQTAHEQIFLALAPLLEMNHPTQEICAFFIKHCKDCPRSKIIIELFTPVVHRILKHSVDFGKFTRMRSFIQEYIQALSAQNDGITVTQNFVKSVHGMCSTCPHPRVLPNLIAVCLAAIYNCYEERKRIQTLANNQSQSAELNDVDHRLRTYLAIFETTSEYSDWRSCLSSLLQPIPFPDDALGHQLFTLHFKATLNNISLDSRCDVHQAVLGIRESKEGWFDLYCPGGIACDDDGDLYSTMLHGLIRCCCRRKKFLQNTLKMIGPWQLLALRENETAMDVLCAVLEFEVCESNDLKMQIITTLQSTTRGKHMYADLCDRQIQLKELQQKGGPRKLTLPTRSTDADLVKLLSSGSFGNLECLSLAFTQVTSACAKELIKLPSLRYLNLWSTQFGDSGLQLLSEHLHKLQVLNLCETPVTDKGLTSLEALKNLRKLNLNSTYLSALTFEGLKEKLPSLQEFDVRYTDAW